jgi:hypothetical protein
LHHLLYAQQMKPFHLKSKIRGFSYEQ